MRHDGFKYTSKVLIGVSFGLLGFIASASIVPARTVKNADPVARVYTVRGTTIDSGTFVTDDGNEWGFSADYTRDLEEGDEVYINFDNNGTPNNIYDDSIISIEREPNLQL